jgi:hypothetical protein
MPKYNTLTKQYCDYLEVLIQNHDYKFTKDDIEVFKQHNKIRLISKRDSSYYQDWSGSINNLPDNITHIELPTKYNQNIEKFPKNLKVLIMNEYYNKELYLSEPLEELIFQTVASEFNQNIIFPSTIKYIQFGDRYDQPLNNLPHSLETLILSNKTSTHPLDNLPSNLKTLKLLNAINNNINLNYLPQCLTYLEITRYDKTELTIGMDNLPSSLQTIKLSGIIGLNNSIRNLPYNLENLYIDVYDNLDLSYLPDNLKNLYITGSRYLEPIKITKLPSKLEILQLTNVIINNSSINILQLDFLPLALKEFSIVNNYNRITSYNMSITLPDSIIKLKIHDSRDLANCLLELNKIPMSCEDLNIYITNNIETRLVIKEITKIPAKISMNTIYLKKIFEKFTF